MIKLTKILNLEGVVVQGYQQLKDIGMIFQIESEKKEARCPRCQEMSDKLHQKHWRIVKDLPMCGQEVYLKINHRQFKCKKCQKPFSEELDFVAPRRNYTKRLANHILKQLKEGDILNVSKINGVTEEEIQRMLEDIGEELSKIDVSGLKRLGLDEIAWVKGQKNYCAVLVDLDKGKPIGILKKRTQEELRKTFMGWGIEILSKIEEVSIDLWEGYRSLIKELIPSAAIVADRFHVMKLVNEEMDKQRREEKKEVNKIKEKKEKAAKLEVLKQSKYSLLKNEKDLTEEQKNKLSEVKETFPKLKEMHKLKEEFREIYESSKDWSEGMLAFGDWLKKSEEIFTESCRTIQRWFGEIISYFDRRTTNGMVEGINNKLKLIKRRGYGFRNFKNFVNRSLLSWYLVS